MIKILANPKVIVIALLATVALGLFGKTVYKHWQEQEEKTQWEQAFTLKKPS